MTKIIPIILSGGAGTRLWPISRRMHPKPFMEVAGKPLLAHALERAALIADEAVILFGIRPTGPETGYGYLQVAEAGDGAQPLASFVEKLISALLIEKIYTFFRLCIKI